MTVGIVGLGLIGASMAKTVKNAKLTVPLPHPHNTAWLPHKDEGRVHRCCSWRSEAVSHNKPPTPITIIFDLEAWLRSAHNEFSMSSFISFLLSNRLDNVIIGFAHRSDLINQDLQLAKQTTLLAT